MLGRRRFIAGSLAASGALAFSRHLPSVNAQEGYDYRFGMNAILPDGFDLNQIPALPWTKLATGSGARSNRWELRWDRTQREPGQGDWHVADWVVSENERYRISLTMVLNGTPRWARTVEDLAISPPINLDQPAVLPNGVANPDNPWATFAYTAARRYRGRVFGWEIWNEPNLGTFWTGTPFQYYQLLKAGYLAIKAADPNARVLMGGMSGAGLEFVRELVSIILQDPEWKRYDGFFDIFSWHGYTRPATIFEYTNTYRTFLGASGLAKPVWIGETGVPAWDDPMVTRGAPVPFGEGATQEEQAHFVVHAYAYGLAAGARRISLYRASDVGEVANPGLPDTVVPGWGAVRLDGSGRPSYAAYQLLVTLLKGSALRQMERGDGFDRISFQAPGRDVHILFAVGAGGHKAQAPAFRSDRAVLIDLSGVAIPIMARNRHFSVDLWGSENQLGRNSDPVVSGPPVIILDGNAPGIPAGGGPFKVQPYSA
ncbi:MAG: hypothetical protein KatS3mg060_1405 [Dehalococcoidia bacterium]|nr:MAG: hypothetical protein KatS3mg060_1405 [Dehalococcoidia bacterium]